MGARVDVIWPRYVGDAGKPPTYAVVYDGLTLPGVYTDRKAAKAMADRYNMVAESNAHDEYSRAT